MNSIVQYICDKLKDVYPHGELFSIAKIILLDLFKLTTIEFYGGKDRSFSQTEMKKIDEIISRLLKKEPIQYIVGSETFHGLTFLVNTSVLIPRPETDELVNWIIKTNSKLSPSILDIGTGSGCIAISLAHEIKHAKVEAWDISAQALATARANGLRNDVSVHFVEHDVFDDNYSKQNYDIIVSNPPYIREVEKENMDNNVLDWEPSSALFVPNDNPLLFYKRIASISKEMLRQGGLLYFEINRSYGKEIVEMLNALGYKDVEIKKDIYDNERMIKACL